MKCNHGYKKFFALLLAFILALGVSGDAFAAQKRVLAQIAEDENGNFVQFNNYDVNMDLKRGKFGGKLYAYYRSLISSPDDVVAYVITETNSLGSEALPSAELLYADADVALTVYQNALNAGGVAAALAALQLLDEDDAADILKGEDIYIPEMQTDGSFIASQNPIYVIDEDGIGFVQGLEQIKNPIDKDEWEFQVAKIKALEEYLSGLKNDLNDPTKFPPENVLYGGDLAKWILDNGLNSKYANKEQVIRDYEQQKLNILTVEELIKYMKTVYPGDWMLTLNPDTDGKATSVFYWSEGKGGYYAYDGSSSATNDGLCKVIDNWVDSVLTLDSDANNEINNWISDILAVYSSILTGQDFDGAANSSAGSPTYNWNIPASDLSANGAASALAALNEAIRGTALPNNVLGFINLSQLGTVGSFNGNYAWSDAYGSKSLSATGQPSPALIDALSYAYAFYNLNADGTFSPNSSVITGPDINPATYANILQSYNVYGAQSYLSVTLLTVIKQALRNYFYENLIAITSSGGSVTNAVNDILIKDETYKEWYELYVFKGSNIFDSGITNGALFRTYKDANERTRDSASIWVTGLDVWNVDRENLKKAWKTQWPNAKWPATVVNSTILVTGTP